MLEPDPEGVAVARTEFVISGVDRIFFSVGGHWGGGLEFFVGGH